MESTESLYRPPGADSPGAPGTPWLIAYRRVALCGVVAAMSLYVLASFELRALAALGVVAALLFWCGLDARVHGKPFPYGIAVPLAVTWPVGIAVYLVWTRGARGLFTYVLWLIATGLVALAASCARPL
jgi:hypothetical protein